MDFLNLDAQQIETITNSQLFLVSGVILIFAGLIKGILSRQYGLVVREWAQMLTIPVLTYVTVLMFSTDYYYIVLYTWFILGEALVSLVYHFIFPKDWYLGPRLKHLVSSNIELDEGRLEFSYPVPNNGGFYPPLDEDFLPDHFEDSDIDVLKYKSYLRRTWIFYDKNGSMSSRITLDVLVHKIPDCGDLRQIENLNKAAALHYFVNYAVPEDSDDGFPHQETYTYQPEDFSNWRPVKINGRDAVTYEILRPNRRYRTQYFHCVLSRDLFLTFEFYVIMGDDEGLLKRVDQLIETLLSRCSVVSEKIPTRSGDQCSSDLENKTQKSQLMPPQFDHFNVILPSDEDYKLDLRAHARDQVEWMVFENSDLFYGWYQDQVQVVCSDYSNLRKAFVDSQVEKYLV